MEIIVTSNVRSFYIWKGMTFLIRRFVIEERCLGGDEGIRTLDPHVANVVLSQLSYIPKTNRFLSLLRHFALFKRNILGAVPSHASLNRLLALPT